MDKLLVLFPLSGLDDTALAERRSRIEQLAGDLRWSSRVLPDTPKSVETPADETRAAAAVVTEIEKLENEFAACLIWCAGDPGVRAARTVTANLVIGPGEASMRAATAIADRFGAVVPLASEMSGYRQQARIAGVIDQLVSVAPVGLPVLELREDFGRTKRMLEPAIAACVDDGAEAVILNCMGLAGLAPWATAQFGLPVIDPVEAAFAQLRQLRALGLGFSPLTYPRVASA